MVVAYTDIRHGDEDGNVVVVKSGEDVKSLPEDVVSDLQEQGLVGDPPKSSQEQDDENAQLKARVAELEAQLQDAAKGAAPANPPETKE